MKLKRLFYRLFCVISIEKAEKLNLTHYRNVYGDEIRYLGWARSIWVDEYGYFYRVESLKESSR